MGGGGQRFGHNYTAQAPSDIRLTTTQNNTSRDQDSMSQASRQFAAGSEFGGK